MRSLCAFILSLFCSVPTFGQEIYLSTYNDIWRFDPQDCSVQFVIYCIRPLYDISFHPDGTLYGTSGDRLYSINLNDGSTTLIHSFTDIGCTSLTTSADGIMYLMGTSGDIWTYDITTDIATNLGPTGFNASGDLTFYKGELYVAANGSRIVKINLEDPSASYVVIEELEDKHIFGIVSDFVDCNEINCYATTNDSSEIYKINFETQTMELVCKLHITVTGGASTAEFLSSVPIGVGTLNVINPDCNNQNGEISIPAATGFGTLEYALNGGIFQNENSFKQLSAGSYMIHIRDQNGCIDSASIDLTVSGGPLINNIITHSSECGVNNGSILVTASGGTPPFEYSLNNNLYQSSGLFENLEPGKYYFSVRDASGCIVNDSAIVSSTSGASIVSVDVQNTTCGFANGSITIHVDEGQGTLFSIDGINFQSDPSFENLNARSYIVATKDTEGCIDTTEVTITETGVPQIEIEFITAAHCNRKDGSFTISATGGIQPYRFSLDGVNFLETNDFTGLDAGTYIVFVMDADGCVNTTQVEIEAEPGPRFANLTITPSECGMKNGSIQWVVEGGVNPVRIKLNNGSPQTESSVDQLSAGNYQLELIDATGCVDDTLVTILQTGCPVYIPNVFSPNGDGVNDLFILQAADGNNITITRFLIFDRWGNNIYEQHDFPMNSTTGWWDGTYKRWTLSAGSYAYYIEVEFEHGEQATYKGSVTLIR